MKSQVWAHRGASAYAPENTLSAFELAVKQKSDGVELDVQLSKDGELVVVHDEKIDRVSNGTGFVKDYNLNELKKFNFNRLFPQYGFVPIATLEEVYELLKPTDLTINVELKTGIIFYEGIEEKLIKLTHKMNIEDRVIYSSFNHYSLLNLRELKYDVKIGLLFADIFVDVPEYAIKIGADALHPAGYILKLPGFIEESKEKNLSLHVWTVDDECEIRRLAEYGIDAIITNKPDTARKVIDILK
ncbi:MAG: glycerophosphodiester phosphodiesterase [Tissierellia bacterium]|nr:glycerophosphodiester phosphodiesterase [Tissierellia bacterium]